MILSDQDIKKKIESGEVKIDPIPDLNVALGTVSVDLRLGNQFMVYRTSSRPYIDVKDTASFDELTDLVVKEKGGSFVIHPGEFVLGSTLENIELPDDLAARLEGKSSVGRLGIVIHSTAGKVDPGFRGHLVLEISNIGAIPVMLYPEMRICQLVFEQLSSPTSQGYTKRSGSKYINQNMPVGSKIIIENNDGDES